MTRERPVVLVTGATGFLGGNLARRLLRDGARLRVLARSAAPDLAALGAEVITGEISDPVAVRAAVRGSTVVYHLAGRLLVPGVPVQEYRRTHIAGTRTLLDACAGVSGLRRFVHCSTTGVVGVTGVRPVTEDAPMRPTNIYEATKAEAELAVRDTMSRGFPAVIARPGLVYGPGDLHLLPFFRLVVSGRFWPVGRRTAWLHPVYIDDLTDGLVRCGEDPDAVGECFHLAGPRPVALTSIARAIAHAAGSRLPPGSIPTGLARVAAAVGDALPASLRGHAPLTRTRLDFVTASRVYDVSKAVRVLGFDASTELADGIAATLNWYRQQGLLRIPRAPASPAAVLSASA